MRPLKPLLLTQLGLIVAIAVCASQARAGEAYTADVASRLTEIAGQEAALGGDRIVFFISGFGRAINVGDTVVCGKRDQAVPDVARLFRSNRLSAPYARTMDQLYAQGYQWLDGSCVSSPSAVVAVNQYIRLGGTVSAIDLANLNLEAPIMPEREEDEWSPLTEWQMWVVQSPTINDTDLTKFNREQIKRWDNVISGVNRATAKCPDVSCFNRIAAEAVIKLDKIKAETGQ